MTRTLSHLGRALLLGAALLAGTAQAQPPPHATTPCTSNSAPNPASPS